MTLKLNQITHNLQIQIIKLTLGFNLTLYSPKEAYFPTEDLPPLIKPLLLDEVL